MGILHFHKWMKENYPKAFQKKWLATYDHVYIDLNYALHNCSYKAKSIDEVKTLTNSLDNIDNQVKKLEERLKDLMENQNELQQKIGNDITAPVEN